MYLVGNWFIMILNSFMSLIYKYLNKKGESHLR
nr:MAG TPA: hypothetical protein [Caudoviricetes sp.]